MVRDSRTKPRIKTSTILGSAIIMMVARLGSLNALKQEKRKRFWRSWLGQRLCGADTMGRVYCRIDLEDIRSIQHGVYSKMKRNKIFEMRGFNLLILDGHESNCSYLRTCPGCLERKIRTNTGDRIQYYHRYVIAMLSSDKFPFLIDVEEQRKGEDEVTCAMRFMKRILKRYPRAFNVVAVDGLYMQARFFRQITSAGKDIVSVLKDERRDLFHDAMGVFENEPSKVEESRNIRREMWDIEGFNSWESLDCPVRVVRSVETRTVTRQITGEKEKETSEWIWATTLSGDKASAQTVVNIGHDRWLIENKAINEMVTYWYADHVYRHNTNAIIGFVLTLMVTLNLFRAFVNLNIKPQLRAKHTDIYFSKWIFAGLYDAALNGGFP